MNVKFLGYQNNPWDLVTDKDICVFPSKTETFGLVYIEAVLNGLPVIASDNLGHKTVQQLFELPRLYPAAEITQLKQQMADSLEIFDDKKIEAVDYQSHVLKRYAPEVAYQNIVAQIEDGDRQANQSIQAIEFLLTGVTRKTKLEILGRKLSQFLTRIRQRME